MPSDAKPLDLKLMTDKAGPTVVSTIATPGTISNSQTTYTWSIPNNINLSLGGGFGGGYYVELGGKAFSARSNSFTINPPTKTQTFTSDQTKRINTWYGKVNQYVDLSKKEWISDPDGVSGADRNKLDYCKKMVSKYC